MEPSHEACDIVSGPVDIGVFGDSNTRRDGDSQPISAPYEMAHIFA